MPKVSVIVPVYNVEKYLDKCLNSLVNQTLEDIEVIIINDSTPDNSQQIINKYVKRYPNKVKSFIKSNGGIADTRNFGLIHATGEYIGFIDGDDYADLSMFEKLYYEAKKNDAQVVSCNFYWKYPEKLVCAKDGPFLNNLEYMVNGVAVLWNKIYKKEWLDQLDFRFIENLRYEDTSFLIKCAPYLSITGYVNEPLVYYVQHQNSITYTQNYKVGDMLKVFNDIFDFYQKHGLYDTYRSELEYLTLKYFLGSSFLRTAQIQDKAVKKNILREGWDLLNTRFPNWRKNQYLLSRNDKKHLYYRYTNKLIYYTLANIIYMVKVKLKK